MVSKKPLIEQTRECGTTKLPQIEKREKVGPAVPVSETSVINTLASSEPTQPQPKVVDAVEHVSLEEGRPKRTVQLGYDITIADRQSLVSLLREYKDVFAFGPEERLGIATSVMEHQLNADPLHNLII